MNTNEQIYRLNAECERLTELLAAANERVITAAAAEEVDS